ncbi:hypothetical protein [uncultured Methylibium sp.]|nr:hypothetical protein [uncultured Methylibium sp.]
MTLRIASCSCGQLQARTDADPAFPAPSFSVYEERMHAWVGLPDAMDHMP